MTTDVGSILLTGNGPSPKDGVWAFCSGGDQRIRGKDGYQYDDDNSLSKTGRLHILEVQRLIRFMPKVVIAVVPGWTAGGLYLKVSSVGHILGKEIQLWFDKPTLKQFYQDSNIGCIWSIDDD